MLTPQEQSNIVDEMIANIERKYFEHVIGMVAFQLFLNGQPLDEIRTSLQSMSTEFVPNPGTLDLNAIATSVNRTTGIVDVDASTPIGVKDRAMIELHNKRANYIINRLQEVQQDLQAIKASSGPADNIRAAIRSAYLATNTRPKSDAVNDYKADIAAGNQDLTG